MCIISKQILLYGSDVQLYNEKAFQNNIKSKYIYPAHIYTTQYKGNKKKWISNTIYPYQPMKPILALAL